MSSADDRIETAVGENRQRYLGLAPGEPWLPDLEVDHGHVRLRTTMSGDKTLRMAEPAGRQSLGLQAGERQGLRLISGANEDTVLIPVSTQRLISQIPAPSLPAP